MSWHGWVSALLTVCMALGLAGCGGGGSVGGPAPGEEAAPRQRLAEALHAQARRADAPAAWPLPVDHAAMLDWAEWKYPALFPKPGLDVRVPFKGETYTVRIYSNGNHLGISDAGVLGLGPFTNHQVLRLGAFGDFVPLVQADACHTRNHDCRLPVIGVQPLSVHTPLGQAVGFSVVATSALPHTYQWQVSLDGGATFADLPGATAAEFSLAAADGSAHGRRYRVQVANRDGTVTSAAATLTLRAPGSQDFFPVLSGARWLYARSDGKAPDLRRVTGYQAVATGEQGTVIETVDGADGSRWGDVYVTTTEGVRAYAADATEGLVTGLNGVQVLRLPIVPGEIVQHPEQLVDSAVDLDHDGRPEPARVLVTMTVLGLETVITPVARFQGALHQRQELLVTLLPTAGGEPIEIRSVVDLWYADGVGEVKAVARSTAAGITETSTTSLESYQVGALVSDGVPPRLLSRVPYGPSTTSGREVRAGFDEALDPASVGPDSLIVFNAQGQRMPGSVSLIRTSELLFSPGRDWPPGEYTVRLGAGLRDRMGNATVVDQTWAFTYDATFPSLLSVAPANGLQDVELSSPVVLTFNEPLLPASVTESSVRLLLLNYETVPALRVIQGNTVIITPLAPLQPATEYRVVVYGVKDLAGNPFNNPTGSTFRTVGGRFAPAAPLAGAMGSVRQLAVGDFNGDGRPDLVGWSNANFDTGTRLQLQLGKPGGGLGEPVSLPWTTDPLCSADGLVVVDLDGDKRSEIVITAFHCGHQVVQLSADGRLVVTDKITEPGTISGVGDLDGSGRQGMLIANRGQVTLWRRAATGAVGGEPLLDARYEGLGQMAVGDLNGDGRPDLVAIVPRGGVLSRLAVFYRQADGQWGPPQELEVDNGADYRSNVRTLAVGDLNGDGRTDIIATAGGLEPYLVVAVFHQTATGGLAPAVHLPTSNYPGVPLIADIDRDGRADLVIPHAIDGELGLYRQRADGTLAPEERYLASTEPVLWNLAAALDVDGDGRVDLLFGNQVIQQRAGLRSSPPSAPRLSRSRRSVSL